MSYAKFTCPDPDCGDVQDPMLHTVNSSCGGNILWGSTLYCEDCGMEITQFRCDECGCWPDQDECATSSGACFIATATYGSAFAPQVIALRRFRDEVLLPSDIGSLFVTAYYFVSPPLASLVSREQLLKSATKYVLLEPILWLIRAGQRHRS